MRVLLLKESGRYSYYQLTLMECEISKKYYLQKIVFIAVMGVRKKNGKSRFSRERLARIDTFRKKTINLNIPSGNQKKKLKHSTFSNHRSTSSGYFFIESHRVCTAIYNLFRLVKKTR